MKNGYLRRLSATVCAALVLLSAGLASAADKKLAGHVPAAATQLTLISALPAATSLHLAIGLPVHNQAALGRLLQQIYDPASPSYHHYLTPEQFNQMFGPSEADYESVLNFARTNGLSVEGTYSNRMVINVSGASSDVEKAFHVKMRLYRHPSENRTFYAPDAEPTVNASLPILNIQGMNNYILPRPMLHKVPAGQPASGSAPYGGYMGQDFRNAYLPGGTLDGTGQIVGLFQFDGYNSSDIQKYEQIAGLPNVPLQNILLDGFNGSAGPANDEVCLDIETSISMAPGLSKVVVFEGLYPDSILSSMAAHSEIKQLSASWGYTIDATTEQLYQQLALQGQTFFNASGDGDAWVGPIPYGCLEDTNITLVGGTTLTMFGPGVSYISEKAWNWGFTGDYNWNPDGYFGTSGGISTRIGIPIWQQGISMAANGGSATMRNVPDVALTADNVFVVSSGGQQNLFGGTSCASPLWAGFMALINQQAVFNSRSPIGFLAPQVYALAKTSIYTNCFNDITHGDNTWPQSPTNFYAVAGYDLCTGLGTPNGLNMVYALAGRSPATGFLQASANPSSGSTLLNSKSQTVNVTINNGGFNVTNATVTAVVSGGVGNVTFANTTPPGAVYSASFLVPAVVSSLTMTVTATAPNVVGTTNVVYYSVVAVPSNDNFTNATKVPAAGGTYLANNQYATIEANEPAHDGDTNAAASLWWSWTPTSNTNVFIDTIGSKIDNVLAVYTGSSLLNLQSVVATNGSVAQFKPAHVSFNAQAGVTYRIAVASYSSSSLGSLVLDITPGGQLDTVAPIVSVVNPLSGQTVTSRGIQISGTAVDPSQSSSSGISQVTVNVNGATTIATGTTNWTTAIALQPALNVVQVRAVDAAGNFSTPVTVDINYLVQTVANDFFVNATNFPLNGTSGVVSMGNTNATKEVGEPDIAGNPGGKSIWWSFTAPSDGVLTLNTTNSNFDTLLGLFTGPNVANLTPIAENDDAYPGAPGGFSFISQAVRANQVYGIVVDGFDGASGTVSLSYTFVPATVYHLAANNTAGGSVLLTTMNSLGGIATLPGQSADFAAGTSVTLSAISYTASQFNNWSGSVSSSANPLVVTLQSDLNLTANFGSIPYTDGFESGDLSHLTWSTADNAPWFVQTNVVDQGQYAARSGVITDSQTSSLILATNFAAGIGSFDFKVSSETNWDFLNFYVDGVLYHQWSGEVGWATYSFALSAGPHTLEWSYAKDPSISVGLDAAFIDDVNLPLDSIYSGQPPQLQLQLQNNGTLLMTISGQASGTCVIQTSTDLINWQNFSTNSATGGSIPITLPANPTNQALFYRAVAY
jgi:hypothetical protein